MPKLTQQEYEEFMTEPGFYARLATVDEDGFPRVIPIAFLFSEGKINFTLRPNSAPQNNVRRDGRVAIAIDEPGGLQRRVIIQGHAQIVFEPGQEDKWVHLHRRMLSKTRSPDSIERYINGMVEARVERPWLEVDLGAPTTRLRTWRTALPTEGDDRLVPFAKQYIVNAPDSAQASEAP
jgi:nitroimidazol reductase NimA-like FMN-containing flavoprotein (pyridoxamine 5'-phosphate oxidase superfamily)